MYTKEEFDRDLKAAVTILESEADEQLPFSEIMHIAKQAERKAGQAILKAKDHLPLDDFWTIVEQNGLTRAEAWHYADDMKEQAHSQIVTRPYLQGVMSETEKANQLLLERCENPNVSEETKMLYLKNHLVEGLAIIREMDQKLPLPARFPTGEQTFLESVKNMREHPEDSLPMDDEEEEEE